MYLPQYPESQILLKSSALEHVEKKLAIKKTYFKKKIIWCYKFDPGLIL